MQRYSKLYTKTKKNSKEYDSVNATLLLKGMFVHQIMAGSYAYLPLGLRVLNKIESIVREEMNKIGTELYLTSLAPKELWAESGRLETIDVLMKTAPANEISKSKSTNEYILNCTHEDMLTWIMREFNTSYKDFPFALYQIQTKFRNEARAKSGVLRGREFRMKDLYSFHTSEEDLKKFYEVAKQAYVNVFNRLGLGDETVIALASGGDFTKEFSHEFQTRCEAGEDLIFFDKKSGVYYNREVAPSKAPDFKQDSEKKKREDVEGKGIIGVEELAKFLNIQVENTTKTILFEDENGKVIAAAVRGDYEIDEIKLKTITGAKELKLASAETVKKVTNAEVGYAGLLNLPEEVSVYMDNSMEGRVNFEMGANKTDFHSINVNFGDDLELPEKFYDFKVAKEGDINPETGEVYEVFKACEVGNIFPINTKFSEAFDYKFTDEDGQQKLVYMGSYGIGTTRAMGVIVEKFHDDKGIIWPESVAPYDVHLVTLNIEDSQVEDLIKQIEATGKEVLWDDRTEASAGEKFADADLIGIPTRIVLSKRSLEQGGVEIKKRNSSESKVVSIDELVNNL